jgi:hypothetical protein
MTLAAPLLLASGGCGWGYAAQTVRPEEGQPQPPQEVEPAKKTPLKAAQGEPLCPVKVFTVFRVEEGNRTTKDVGCDTGQTLSVSRKDITSDELRGYLALNVPAGRWYVIVDPKQQEQIQGFAITNAQLVGLTRRYPFKFYDRMPDTGLLIYLYGESAGEVLPPNPYKTQP